MKRMVIALSSAVLAWGLGSHPASAQEARGPKVWVASSIHGWIHIIHPETNQLDRVLRDDLPGARRELCWVGAGGYSDLAVGEGRLWAVAPGEGVCGIDPSFNAPPLSGRGQARADQVAAGEGSVWTIHGAWATRLDPASGEVTDSVSFDYDRTAHVALAGGRVWISTHDKWDVFHLPVGGGSRPDSLNLGGSGASLATGAGSLWAYGPGWEEGMFLWRLDPSGGAVQARVPVPLASRAHGDHSIAVGGGSVWLGLGELGLVARVDPTANALSGSVDAGEWVVGLATGAGSLWVLTQGDLNAHVLRIDPASLDILARITLDDGVQAIAVF